MKQKMVRKYKSYRYDELPFVRKLQIHLLLAWGCLILLFFLLDSCTLEDVEDVQKVDTETDATFFLNPPVMQNLLFTENEPTKADEEPIADADSVLTKAPGTLTSEEEKRIRTLWVGQFASDGALLFSQYYPEETDQDVNSELALRLKVTTTACTLYFVANTDKIRDFAGDKAAFEALTLEHSTTDDGFPIPRRCVMLGSWTGPVGRGGVTGEVSMKRVFAKITLNYSFAGTGFSFTIERVKLRNVPKTYRLLELEGQLPDVPESYREYWDNGSSINGTIHWYLPENKAGIASGANAVQSVRDKIGAGVNRAICMDILGTAKQGNITYKDVCFRLYPGGTNAADNNMNNYTVARNCQYTINLRLVGIDLSDKRVSVGEIPPISNPDNMSPEKGATKSVQITARPGQSWMMQLPAWLSATIGGTSFPAGGNITYEGPVLVDFKAATANPDAKERAHAFTLQIPDAQTFSVKQNPSSMNMRLSTDVTQNLAPTATTGTCFVTATAGLPFTGMIRHDGGATWVSLTGNYNNQVATGTEQTFGYSITPNPSGTDWRGTAIQVQAGNIIKEIPFVQLNSALFVCGENVISAAGVPAINSDFQTTAGLNWQLTHNMPWITLHTPTGGVVSSNDPQLIGYYVAPNPSRSQREGHFTIKVGNGIDKGDVNLQKNIKITQQGAFLNTRVDQPTIGAVKDSKGNFFFHCVAGFDYTVILPDWIVADGQTTTGRTDGNLQQFNFKANSTNPNAAVRTGRITVRAGEMEAYADITQAGSTFGVYTRSGGNILYPFEGSLDLKFNDRSDISLFVYGSSGLTWGIRKESGDAAFTTGTSQTETTGEYQFLIFNVNSDNMGTQPRSAVFTVYQNGGDGSRNRTITITQRNNPNLIMIDQATADAYKLKTEGDTKYQPFNYRGMQTGSIVGEDLHGNSATYMVDEPYVIEVEASQSGYQQAPSSNPKYCDKFAIVVGENRWRVPTHIELFTIWTKCKDNTGNASQSSLFGALLKKNIYMSSSLYGNKGVNANKVSKLHMGTGTFSYSGGIDTYVRCVREVKMK